VARVVFFTSIVAFPTGFVPSVTIPDTVWEKAVAVQNKQQKNDSSLIEDAAMRLVVLLIIAIVSLV